MITTFTKTSIRRDLPGCADRCAVVGGQVFGMKPAIHHAINPRDGGCAL